MHESKVLSSDIKLARNRRSPSSKLTVLVNWFCQEPRSKVVILNSLPKSCDLKTLRKKTLKKLLWKK